MRTHAAPFARLNHPRQALLQRGMTLIELLVAMTLGLLIALAAAAIPPHTDALAQAGVVFFQRARHRRLANAGFGA